MDIPLKSRPKVSMVGLHDESSFEATPLTVGDSSSTIITSDGGTQLRNPKTRAPNATTSSTNNTTSMSQPISIVAESVIDANGAVEDDLGPLMHPKSFRLTRTYSESEKNNFHLVTGHRMYDDGKIRPTNSRTNSYLHLDDDESPTSSLSSNRLYSRSHNEYMSSDNGAPLPGLEDEYIPGLDFSALVYDWTHNASDQNLARTGALYDDSLSSSSSTNPSRDVSYLDLNKLHAKVSPQPIVRDLKDSMSKFNFGKLHPNNKLRRSKTTLTDYNREDLRGLFGGELGSDTRDPLDNNHKVKRQKSAVDPVTGEVNYEFIMNSLPQNFNDLPYSQRKKLVKSFSESIDYSQFSMFAKSFLSKGGSGSNNSSFIAKSRRGSANTIAGRLLAISSTTDLKTMPEEPKYNVDEKGAIVMGHVLGKVIGFGAWGTIRQCTSPEGKILAIKIVKSTKDSDGSLSKTPKENAKVLTFFKKEIEIWKKLHHKHILPLIKYLETEHAIFCITERINGGTLFELVTAWGPLSGGIIQTQGPITYEVSKQTDRVRKVIDYIKQIVDAVKYMHGEMGIVHGDLKLENVLVDDTTEENQMVLCDFGMSRVYDARVRLSRNNSLKVPDMARSQSSSTAIRKPFGGNDESVRHLFKDDSKIGISNLYKVHGPSLQSVDLTPTQSLSHFHDYNRHGFDSSESDIDSDLPHTHIGSLPYASPELLLPSPPPLGPSADVWALGVLLFTMLVGKLPFQHQYEPRLRAMIAHGKFNSKLLRRGCMMEWFVESEENLDDGANEKFSSASFGDHERQDIIKGLHEEWLARDTKQYSWLFDLVCGCLEKDITKRLDIYLIDETLQRLG